MSNHFSHILKHYLDEHQQYDEQAPWVLSSLIEKQGSSYRSVGALMLVGPEGQSLGGLSGGCLERDIVQQAYQVSMDKKPRVSIYDTRDPDDNYLMHQTGCQGKVHILFTPIDVVFHQQLCEIYAQLQQGREQYLALSTQADTTRFSLVLKGSEVDTAEPINKEDNLKASYQSIRGERYSVIRIEPAKSLWVIGGGYDAEPLVRIAKNIGWHVTVWDDRLHYAKDSNFSEADQILRFSCEDTDTLCRHLSVDKCDAAVLMTHHLGKDAAWLNVLSKHHECIRYIAMIGPLKRRDWVLDVCQKEFGMEDSTWLKARVYSPAGFEIGGDTPESVALSILAQAHKIIV